MKKLIFMLCFAFGVFAEVGAQDSLYTRSIIKTLCSDNFHGRGYVNNGDRRAANFIKDEFVKNGISTVSLNNYFQDFSFSVNTFPAKMEVKIDGNSIEPGRDFIVQPESPTCKGKFDVLYIDKKLSEYSIEVIKEKWILLDTTRGENPFSKEEYQTWLSLDEHIKGIIQVIPKKLTWSDGTTQNKIPTIQILKSDYTNKIQKLEVNNKYKFI